MRLAVGEHTRLELAHGWRRRGERGRRRRADGEARVDGGASDGRDGADAEVLRATRGNGRCLDAADRNGVIHGRAAVEPGRGRGDGDGLRECGVVALCNEDLCLERRVGLAGVVRARLALLADTAGGPAKLSTTLALCGGRGHRRKGLVLHWKRGREGAIVLDLLALRGKHREPGLGLEKTECTSNLAFVVDGIAVREPNISGAARFDHRDGAATLVLV